MLTTRRVLIILCLALSAFSLGAARRELASPVVAPTNYATEPPLIAFADDRFLTVWRERMGNIGSPVMAALSDMEGRRITDRAFPLELPRIWNPQSMRLVGAGQSFALFWEDGAAGAQMALIDREGRVTRIVPLALPRQFRWAFAWNGTHFLAIVERAAGPTAEAFLFDPEGRMARQPIALANRADTFAVAVVDGRFVVVASGWRGLFAQTITIDGIAGEKVIEPESGAGYRPYDVVATPTGDGGVLVVWSAGTASQAELKSAIYRVDGSLTATSLLTTHAGRIAPVGLLRTGEGYVLAFATASSNNLDPAQFSMSLDALGAKKTDPAMLTADGSFIASSATRNGLLLIAFQSGIPSRIATVAIDGDGRPREPELMSIGLSRQMQPILGSGGGRVLATWTETAGEAAAVRASDVGADGEPRPATHIASAFLTSREIAWNGVHHLAVHRDLTRLMATRVGADGRPLDEQPIKLADFAEHGWEYVASVAWAGTHWLVVWRDGEHLRVLDVSRGGIASVPRTLDVQQPLDPIYSDRRILPPVIAFDGRQVLLVWSEEHSRPCYFPGCEPPDTKLFATRLTADGTPFGHTFETDLPSAVPLSVASSGEEFLVLAGTRAFVLDADHSVINLVASRQVFGFFAATDVTWDGRAYVVALRYSVGRWYLATLRLDRSARAVAAPLGTATLPQDAFEPPSVAAPFGGEAIVGVQEGTAAGGARAVVYRESELTPLPPPPAAPQNVRVRPVPPHGFEVTWDPSPTGHVEIYVIEANTARDVWTMVAQVGGDTLRARTGSWKVRVRAVNAGGTSAATEPVYAKRRSVR